MIRVVVDGADKMPAIPVAKEFDVGLGDAPVRSRLSDAFNSAARGMDKDAYVPAPSKRLPPATPQPSSYPPPFPTFDPPKAPVHIAPAHYHDAFNIDQMLGNALSALTFFLQGIREDSLAADVMRAAVNGDSDAMRNLLRRDDVLPELSNAQGLTPLMAAAARGHTDVVELLAAHPLVDVGKATPSGWTALHYAAHFGQEDAVRALLKHMAPPDAKTLRGDTPYDIARDKPVEKAFWQDKNFIIYMKKTDRDNPRLQAAKKTETPQPLPAAAPVFIDNNNPPAFEAMHDVSLGTAFAQYRESNDWEETFIKAAALDNVDAMIFLQAMIKLPQDVLDRALAATIQDGDNRNAAGYLIDWGADPDAHIAPDGRRTNQTIFVRALGAKRLGTVEEMMLWSKNLPGTKIVIDTERDVLAQNIATFKGLIDDARRQWDGQNEIPKLQEGLKKEEERVLTLNLWVGRSLSEKFSKKMLRDNFVRATESNDIKGAMTAYAAGRKAGFFGNGMRFDAAAGGRAIALALLNKRYHFANILLHDGYKPQDGRIDDLAAQINTNFDDLAQSLLRAYSGKTPEDKAKDPLDDIPKAVPLSH